MNNKILKGSLLVGLGASSYGVLATFVKMAYGEGFNIAEVTLAQSGLGVIGLLLLNLFRKSETAPASKTTDSKSIWKLVLAGSFMGLTSVFYYKAVQYIPVSVGIVLLMQTVWLGVILEMILQRKWPGIRKIIAVFIILAGTALATGLFRQSIYIHWAGFGWGMLAALTYTGTIYSSNHVSVHLAPLRRSLYMVLGSLIIIALIFHNSFNSNFSYAIFLRWGIILSLFGTILLPLLFTKGLPLTGMGLGAIIAAVEIPVSVFMAYLLLQEPVTLLQWLGVVLILFAVVLMNIRTRSGPELVERNSTAV